MTADEWELDFVNKAKPVLCRKEPNRARQWRWIRRQDAEASLGEDDQPDDDETPSYPVSLPADGIRFDVPPGENVYIQTICGWR